MKLVIYGMEPLATLRGWAEALFATIPTSGRTYPTFGNEVPLDASRLARVIQVHPVKDLRIIDLSWTLPSLHGDYLTKPTKILSHLIGHEGAGSIFFELSQSPIVGQWPLEPEILAREILRLVKNPRVQGRRTLEHVDVLVHHFHDVKDMLMPASVTSTLTQKRAQSSSSRQSLATESSREQGGAHPYAPKYMLTGSHLLYDFDAEKVQHVNLLTATRMRLTVVSKTFEGTTEYVENAPIASSLLERWASPPLNGALQLPHRNEFVCHDFRIVTPPSPVSGIPVTSPFLLQEDETCRLWYEPDVDLRKPNLLPHFRLDSPALSTTPYHAVLTSLFVRYVKDTLTEMAYEDELAGMEYELGLHARALELFAGGGYSENLPILVSKVLDQMLAMTSATYPLDEAIFQRVKDRTKRMYENLYLEDPY
ncbi:hypothetical protein PsorP6_000967 [Peronosclerospora sorghi]|uniref:Uncharacterized protein n=1 Tax=Peronosclerospora sorghi TaxID=230839 RepID=A0ACC0WRA2_9STRA|nr:hypothetical protein PsorP6_000967 [Peronosclerospora sorghi]